MAGLSKSWVCGRSLAGIVGSIPTMPLGSNVCCQVEITASG